MRSLIALLIGAALILGACGGDEDEQTLIVSAAASLTESFTEMAEAFEAASDGVTVELNFGASSALATQIIEGGAPVDVFASANEAQMNRVRDAGDATDAHVFAYNELVIAVPPGSTMTALEDLAQPGVRLVLAAPDVPIGAYAREVLEAADASGQFGSDFETAVLANLVSEEANVRQVLTKVELGEADAGLVYATDAIVSGDQVEVIPVPEEFAPLAVYPIAVITGSEDSEPANDFVEFTLSDEGRAILERHGFRAP